MGAAELVVGPKLGAWAFSESATQNGQDAGSGTANGFVYGLNAGIFGNITPSMAIGGLINLEGRSYSKACFTDPGSTQVCSTSGLPDADKVLGINGALMF
jgi:hypothetical protein